MAALFDIRIYELVPRSIQSSSEAIPHRAKPLHGAERSQRPLGRNHARLSSERARTYFGESIAPYARTAHALLGCGMLAGPLYVVGLLQPLRRDGFHHRRQSSDLWLRR